LPFPFRTAPLTANGWGQRTTSSVLEQASWLLGEMLLDQPCKAPRALSFGWSICNKPATIE
jgi:hypothetical protein